MSELADSNWRQFWIFQANPKQYRSVKAQLAIGNEVNWYVSRFIERYRVGDIVYLWIAGEEAGIYGWAEVTSEVFKDEDGNQRLTTVYRGVLNIPLTRDLLRRQPAVFDGLTILRNPTGANFRVTALEALEINRLIRENDEQPAPDPDQIEDPNQRGEMYLRAVYVLDYRFDNDVKSIVATCLLASQNINQTFFPRLLIQSTFWYFAAQLQREDSSELARGLNEILPLERIVSEFNFVEKLSYVAPAELAPPLASGVMVKRAVLTLLASARRMAIISTGKEQIMARHLIAAILQGATENLQNYLQSEILKRHSLKLDEVRDRYLDILEKHWPEDKINLWRNLLHEEVIQSKIESSEIGAVLLTKIDSDSADDSAVDLLDIDDDTVAIAKILCAKDAAPPLAIGLFGEWGSGKTFFMRRISRHVKSLTERVAANSTNDTQQDETQRAYQAKVAQIWFNAWNYQDGKLWASLVNHVFSGLKQELKRLNKDNADEEFQSLIERLDEDRQMEKELQATSTRLQALNDKQGELSSRIKVLQETNEAIQKEKPEKQSRPLSLGQLKKYGKDIEDVFNIQGADAAVQSFSDNLERVRGIVEQCASGNIFSRIKQWVAFGVANKKNLLLLVLGLIVIAIVSDALFNFYKDSWARITTVLPALVSLWSLRFSKLGKILHLVGQLKREFDSSSRQSNQELQHKLDLNAKKLQELQIQLLQTNAEIRQSQQEYAKLNADYGTPSDETFANFVYARAASSDYQGQLGLLNTVRRDFSRLNELLINQNDKKLPKLDRIVLYIDDLDRCEPDVVVDVLQAIHLMLAFPLFMVVVGVDARWLGRSLKSRYDFLVHEKEEKDGAALDHHAASTHDYLEKIFQIPFWLRRLDGDRANNMMKRLLKPSVVEPGLSDKSVTADSDNQQNGERQSNKTSADDANSISDLQSSKALNEETEDQAEGYQENRGNDDELLITNLVSTRALEMSGAELACFEQLGSVVGRSPRAVKRFINLYRILKASHKKARLVGFSEEGGEFKVPLFLLAVICGCPKEAEAFFRFVKLQAGKGNFSAALPAAKKYQDGHGWGQLLEAISLSLKEIGDLPISQMIDWISDVSRFSYREWVE